MPRRMIDSRIFLNEDLGELPLGGRLLFKSIILHADDQGRLKAGPKFLRATTFPYDDVDVISTENIEAWRDQLNDMGYIRLYSKQGADYLDIPGWLDPASDHYQNIRRDRYTPSLLPSYDDADEKRGTGRKPFFMSTQPLTQHETPLKHKIVELLTQQIWKPTGEEIVSVEQEKRVGNLYIDILATTKTSLIIIETKAFPLQPGHLDQVSRYVTALTSRNNSSRPIYAFLIGRSRDLIKEERGITVLTYADLPNVEVVDTTVKDVEPTVDITVHPTRTPNVTQRNLTKRNNTLPSGSVPTSPEETVESTVDSPGGSVRVGAPLPAVKPDVEHERGEATPAKKKRVSGAEKGADSKKVSGAEKGADSKESDVTRVFKAVHDFYGYPDKDPVDRIPNYGKEGAAIKRILTRGFSVEQIMECWKVKVAAKNGDFVPFAFINEDIGKEQGGTRQGASAHRRHDPSFGNYEEANRRFREGQS